MSSKPLTLTATVAASAIALTGCGGGSSGPLLAPATDPPPVRTASAVSITPINAPGIEPLLAPESEKVRVGVVDSGVRPQHFRIRDSLVATYIAAGSSGGIEDFEEPHGTAVAQIIANGSRNEHLYVAKAYNAQLQGVSSNSILDGTRWLHSNNVRVINYSIGPLFFTNVQATRSMHTENRANNVVSVLAAGNERASITSRTLNRDHVFSDPQLRESILVVGSLGANNLPTSYTNIPGADPNIQSRFLVTRVPELIYTDEATGPGGPTTTMRGTSAVTPVVTAAVTNLIARWPALTAPQITQLILTRTDRSFTNAYDANNCGDSRTLNCGLYFFGQGKLDMLRVLQPLGPVSFALTPRVDGPSAPLETSNITLPAAFGDVGRTAKLETVGFDSLGRDYTVNVAGAIGAQRSRSLKRDFENLIDQTTHSHRNPAGQINLSFSEGRLNLAELEFKREMLSLNFLQNNRLNSIDKFLDTQLSFNSNGVFSGYNNKTQFGLGLNLSPTIQVFSNFTRAANTSGNIDRVTASAGQHAVGLNLQLSDASKFSLAHEITHERHGVFGFTGSGAFGLNGSTHQATRVQLTNQHSNGWSSFGMVRLGHLITNGSGLLSSISDARTSEFAAGLNWKTQDQRLRFAVSQPMRVDFAQAHFNVATGRTLEGEVLRNTKVLNIQPSGRQLNLEFSYEQRLDANDTINFYAMHAQNIGHVRGANDFLLGVIYRANW